MMVFLNGSEHPSSDDEDEDEQPWLKKEIEGYIEQLKLLDPKRSPFLTKTLDWFLSLFMLFLSISMVSHAPSSYIHNTYQVEKQQRQLPLPLNLCSSNPQPASGDSRC